MPTTPATVAVTVAAVPYPCASRQTTAVPDAHDVVPQLLSPTRAEGVSVRGAKLMPVTVTLQPAVTTALASAAKLTTGAAPRCKVRRVKRQTAAQEGQAAATYRRRAPTTGASRVSEAQASAGSGGL